MLLSTSVSVRAEAGVWKKYNVQHYKLPLWLSHIEHVQSWWNSREKEWWRVFYMVLMLRKMHVSNVLWAECCHVGKPTCRHTQVQVKCSPSEASQLFSLSIVRNAQIVKGLHSYCAPWSIPYSHTNGKGSHTKCQPTGNSKTQVHV